MKQKYQIVLEVEFDDTTPLASGLSFGSPTHWDYSALLSGKDDLPIYARATSVVEMCCEANIWFFTNADRDESEKFEPYDHDTTCRYYISVEDYYGIEADDDDDETDTDLLFEPVLRQNGQAVSLYIGL